MNVRDAAIQTGVLLYNYPEVETPNCNGLHLHEMLTEIAYGTVTDEKAHRWLGYVQGVLVAYEHATVEQFKEINKNV